MSLEGNKRKIRIKIYEKFHGKKWNFKSLDLIELSTIASNFHSRRSYSWFVILAHCLHVVVFCHIKERPKWERGLGAPMSAYNKEILDPILITEIFYTFYSFFLLSSFTVMCILFTEKKNCSNVKYACKISDNL